MQESPDLESVAQGLFDAFVAHDLDAVDAMLAPDVTIVQNGRSATWEQFRRVVEGLRSVIGDQHYENVRRVVGDRAVVEEHDIVSTLPSGKHIRLPACVVIRVNERGLISSLDEYVDTAPLA